ncbi:MULTISPECIES: TonB-dependent receptor [unclassified Sphingomonas]|uniref:TonB-dependent receptor n=1 Tax=Novosphingobium rhizosphaerae TaxID=1551649 RepID=UPI0015CD25CC
MSSRFALLSAVSVVAVIGGASAHAAVTPAGADVASDQAATAPAPAQDATVAGSGTQMVTSEGQPGVDANGDGIDDVTGEILVIATPLKGVVKADQPPIVTLDEEAIASYGVSSIQELLAVLAPQTDSGRGRSSDGPVILLNGLRISSFREMRGLPPEAIRRVEVLPEEVALKYGYRPDQRVVNFILKDHYKSLSTETEVDLPGNGSYAALSEEATLAKIANKARINVTGTVSTQSAITEAERGISQQSTTSGSTVAGDPAQADYRTLQAKADSAALNATWSKPIGLGTGLTLNVLAQRDYSRSWNGLNTVTLTDNGTDVTRTTTAPEPLTTRTYTTTLSAGAGLNAGLGAWQLSVTADGSHVETDTRIDRNADLSGLQSLVDDGSLSATGALPASAIVAGGIDRALSRTNTLTSLATLNGQPFRLPGGAASLTVKTGFAYSGIHSTDTRTTTGAIDLNRGDAQVGFSLDLPITSKRENFGGFLGNLSLNLNAEAHRLSDFGGLYDFGGGLTWRPTNKLSFTATFIGAETAPTLSQLGAPTTTTQNVAIYDFIKGATVLATVTSGGNPDLLKERQRDVKLAGNWTLPFLTNSTFIVEYFRNRSFNTSNSFPLLTAEVEAAYPGRVVRNAAGDIVSVDESPVTFAREESNSLRYGINLSGSFGTPDPNMRRSGGMRGMVPGGFGPGGPGGPGGGPRMGAAGGGGPGGGPGGPPPGGPGGPGGFDGRGRWNLSLTHTIMLMDRVQLTPGGTVYNLLGGDALSSTGVARHSIELEGGGFYRSFGVRFTGTYTGAAHADSGTTSLDFHPIAKFNLRLFADLGRRPGVVKAVPFLKNARVSLAVNNLFDAQQKVTDQNGDIPLRYQAGYLDPTGRVFKIEFRKQF